MENLFTIKIIGMAKETESPENPGALEKRVALVPKDIKKLIESNCTVYVENGSGEGVGYSDQDYMDVGAIIQNSEEIYKNKEMVIKFKGPSLENINKMNPGTILFCMAHFRSFQSRAELLEKQKINVIAMEEILESPKWIPDEIILSKKFVEETLCSQSNSYDELDIGFIGFDLNIVGGIRRAGNRQSKTLTLYQEDIKLDELLFLNKTSLFFYDSRLLKDSSIIDQLKSYGCQVYDFKQFLNERENEVIKEYRANHPPFHFGGRKIQCLHETGVAGARYGFQLLEEDNIKACVLGYGNVGMGAINECYDQGVRAIQILGRTQTKAGVIDKFLLDSHLIVNGAEQPVELRGKNYLIKKDYVGKSIHAGNVVIDLVGGSAVNRSPVEDIIECTYLTDPSFTREGVKFSALWGWPMMGMMKESAEKYSKQIIDVLVFNEKLLKGINYLSPGVKQALVCGPF